MTTRGELSPALGPNASADPLKRLVEIPYHVEPRVTVLILAYRRQTLPDAVAALVASTKTTEYQVAILLNGASPEVTTAVRDEISGANILESPINLGFSAGMNMLAEKAQGEFIALLNDDTEVQDGWLDTLVATADSTPAAGMITSRLLFPDGRMQEAGARLNLEGVGVQIGWGEPDTDDSLWHRREVDYGSAAALLIRRESFERVGGFDEAFFPAYYEDVDLALRIRAAGWTAVYEPMAIATHQQWGSTTLGERTYSMSYNRRTFLARWGTMFSRCGQPSSTITEDLIDLPAGAVTEVETSVATTPWEHYSGWLVEQLMAANASRLQTEHQLDVLGAELVEASSHLAATQQQLTACDERLLAAHALAVQNAERAAHHEAARAEIESLAMWKVRRSASRVLRRSARMANQLDRRNLR